MHVFVCVGAGTSMSGCLCAGQRTTLGFCAWYSPRLGWSLFIIHHCTVRGSWPTIVQGVSSFYLPSQGRNPRIATSNYTLTSCRFWTFKLRSSLVHSDCSTHRAISPACIFYFLSFQNKAKGLQVKGQPWLHSYVLMQEGKTHYNSSIIVIPFLCNYM